MTRQELVDSIKTELRELEARVGKLNEEELTIFILWKLIERKSFDPKYYFGSRTEREKIYKLAQKSSNHKPSKDDESKRDLICVSMSAEFKYIAEELGLKVSLERVTYTDGSSSDYSIVDDLRAGDHLFNIVHCSNGQKIEIDVQKELAKMQTKSMPEEVDFDFDKDSHLFQRRSQAREEEIRKQNNKQKLDSILRKIGYIGEGELYTDEICKKIISESQGCSEVEIVRRIIENPTIQERFNKSRISELHRTYKRHFKYNGDFDCTVALPCYVERKFGTRQYSLCIYSEDNGEVGIWMYSRKNQKMEPVGLETMRSFLENGLNFITDTSADSYKLNRLVASMIRRIAKNKTPEEISMDVDDILELD